MIGVSQGTAAVLELRRSRQAVVPRTAYLMHGQGCDNDCGFCAQARSSSAGSRMLSRVAWPEFPMAETIAALREAAAAGVIGRVCVQVVACGERRQELIDVISAVVPVGVPVSVSMSVRAGDMARELSEIGVERIALPIDVANRERYRQIKGGDLDRDLGRIEQLTAEGIKVASHLIIGMGESEEEAVRMLAWCRDRNVRCGLFAFTPVAGTKLADCKPPAMSQYRMIQLVRSLLDRGQQLDSIEFAEGRVVGFRCDRGEITAAAEVAFETSGCPDCNRPFYNERPAGPWFNYPRPLTAEELEQALTQALAGRRVEG